MKTICFASRKGGVGKSTATVLVARCLASSGKKILLIDLDSQMSSSFCFMPDNLREQDSFGNHHIAAAMQSENDICDFAVHSNCQNIDLIRSYVDLPDLRSISQFRLQQSFNSSQKIQSYDFVLIDTQGTYDNLSMNGMQAADRIILPLFLSQFDFDCARYLEKKLKLEIPNGYEKLSLFFNGLHYKNGEVTKNDKDYIELYKSNFSEEKFLKTNFSFTQKFKAIIDRDIKIGKSESFSKIRNEIISLASEIAGGNVSPSDSF